jgi:hypothetical protein|tara:strand:+ start:434 stop:979 length:546 start_codon:yes stop_codon:yes gene_type:complete
MTKDRKKEYQIFKEYRNNLFSFDDYDSQEQKELETLSKKFKQKKLDKVEKVRFKRLRFRHFAQTRMGILLVDLKRLEQLFNKSHYNYDNNLLNQMNAKLNETLRRSKMNNLFKLKKSDDPLLTDDEYVYVKDATVTIQICGKGRYCVNKWVSKEETMYHSDFMPLSNAMKLVIDKKYEGIK